MTQEAYQKLLAAVDKESQPIDLDKPNLDALLKQIGEARFVLLGESTHGTYEFYQLRAHLTQRLVTEKGFMAIAIEGDWPSAYQINRYIQGQIHDSQAVLAAFNRFPRWMWRNHVVKQFIEWLRFYNNQNQFKVKFYGLDLYSLHTSISAVIDYLTEQDPPAAERAKKRYSCFNRCTQDPDTYGYLYHNGLKKDCIQAVTEQLLELQHQTFSYLKDSQLEEQEALFYATQNARLIKNAEAYYRTIFSGHVSSWNVRDRHMFETLNVIANHLEQHTGKPAKIIVWAHNSHIGDARATEMGDKGEINIGQLVREQFGAAARLIGFSTYTGTVTAASAWGQNAECKQLVPGLPGSYEELFHHASQPNFWLNLIHGSQAEQLLHIHRLQRAIGVIYRPDTERHSHYFFTRLPYQFDAIIHIDKTLALNPLLSKKKHKAEESEEEELETYPTGF